MIPLVTAIEDLDAVLPEDAQVGWDQAGESEFALTITSGERSFRFAVDSETLLQRGEPYRKFLGGIARVLGIMAVDYPNRRSPERHLAVAA
jgi:hypothetical protein